MIPMLRIALGVIASLVLAVPVVAQPKAERVESKGGVVVCVSPPAAEVGLTILKNFSGWSGSEC